MRLYHFTASKYALDDLAKQRLKVAQLQELNDPFELRSLCEEGTDYRIDLDNFCGGWARKFGLICFSKNCSSVLMWSHYADNHRGICLGFDVEGEREKFGPVHYRTERTHSLPKNSPNPAWMSRMLHTKSSEWKHEEEWRVFVNLATPEWNETAGRDLYFVNFSQELILREVIFGVHCEEKEADIRILDESKDVIVKRLNLSSTSFKLV